MSIIDSANEKLSVENTDLKINNQEILFYSIKNKSGLELKVTNFGATIFSLEIPSKNGKNDVVLGFNKIEDYVKSFEKDGSPFFSAVVGRFAGRIANSQFPLNGKTIYLDHNLGKHHLHGGKNHISNVIWDFIKYDEKSNTITFSYLSKTNEYYPGDVTIDVSYTLSEGNALIVTYNATTTEDTLLNLTQHAYFNLDGQNGNVSEQKLTVNADVFLEVDSDCIPTGNLINLNNHSFDFRIPKNVVPGINDCFVLKNNTEPAPAAVLHSEKNNLTMKVFTNQPAVQIYVGGMISDEFTAKESAKYHSESGICFETQAFPDAPNHENFPNAILRKGEKYFHETTFQFCF